MPPNQNRRGNPQLQGADTHAVPTLRNHCLNLRVIGTVGLLMAGKERGFLARIRPELDRLLAVRFFMDQELYDRVVAQVGEQS